MSSLQKAKIAAPTVMLWAFFGNNQLLVVRVLLTIECEVRMLNSGLTSGHWCTDSLASWASGKIK